ncbi:hypothetical protein L3Q82_014140 [Scortum barcoo]|uniref:Uncharacterized protein n=1 Tax=Scortum barcoo TaxID=214431 RepID=A0ACB8VVZ4_9TELE|nr:hypothetical protein L3Q82_014140 [Scortum barcoo]
MWRRETQQSITVTTWDSSAKEEVSQLVDDDGTALQPATLRLPRDLCKDPVCGLQFGIQHNHPGHSSTPNSPSSLCQLPPPPNRTGTDYKQTVRTAEKTTGASLSSIQDLYMSRGSSLPPPVLTVFPPSSAELQSNKASLVCLSSQSVPFADVSWLSGGSPVSSGISTSTAVQQADRTFQISSYLAIQTSDWNMDKVYTCKVSLGSQTSEKNINKSSCPTEE